MLVAIFVVAVVCLYLLIVRFNKLMIVCSASCNFFQLCMKTKYIDCRMLIYALFSFCFFVIFCVY